MSNICSTLNEKGQEVFDQTPIEIPIKFERPIPLHIRIRTQIIQAMKDAKSLEDYDSPEEADDFDMDEVNEPWEKSRYEVDFDHINESDNKSTSATNAESSPHEEAETAEGTKPEAENH